MRAAVCLLVLLPIVAPAAEKEPPVYEKQIAPLFRKYCSACHNSEDREGKLNLESFAELLKGGKHGPAISPGSAASSRMYQLITSKGDNRMPPEGFEAPKPAEVELIKAWLDAGAKGPAGKEPDRTALIVPKLPAAPSGGKPITALDWSPTGKLLAVGRFKTIELRDPKTLRVLKRLTGHPGKINSLRFTADGSLLIAATGVTGLYGEAHVWSLASGKRLRTIRGHRDTLYAAVPDPKGQLLATTSYDRKVILWDLKTGKHLREIAGHNGAVFDAAFSPNGTLLATASADETVKVWQVSTGRRLDTLGQPQKEQYAVVFSPNGRFIYAGGADNRIRRWRVVSKTEPKINPLTHARFAHEGAILRLAFSADRKTLVSLADDRTLKLWTARRLRPVKLYETQPAVSPVLAASPNSAEFVVGRLDGSLKTYSIDDSRTKPTRVRPVKPIVVSDSAMGTVAEVEPNNETKQAQQVKVPVVVKGAIGAAGDADLYRFSAKAGEQWMIEIKGSRMKSPLDSKIEVLTDSGERIVRQKLQAVRDSYFTFRGKNSEISDDFRVFNWQEMELNEYLYAGGEVVKLWLYPRGPDSGFKVYPGFGKRHNFFDTSAKAHALHAPCYIVRPLPPSANPLPNGLPILPIYFENDDDAQRQWGRDSRLTFTAPADGNYLVRVADVRSFGGEDFKYELTIRPRRPGFRVRLEGANPTVPPGAGREFAVRADRIDGFTGPIHVEIENLPAGFTATNPIIIEEGQYLAHGSIYAASNASPPAKATTKVTASAVINGKEVTQNVNNLGVIKLAKKAPKVRVHVLPIDGTLKEQQPGQPWVLEIAPGETVRAIVRVDRAGFNGRIGFGKEDAGRNLPHGLYVDNIGLNGLLIVEKQLRRQFFITAAKWVQPTERLFHLRAQVEGTVTSLPVLIRVREQADPR